MKNCSLKRLWPGFSHVLIREPPRAPARRTVGLSGHAVSPLGLLGRNVVGRVPGGAEDRCLGWRRQQSPRHRRPPCTAVGSEVHGREGLTGQGLDPQVHLSRLLTSCWPKQVTHVSLVSKGAHCGVTLRGCGERGKEELRVTFAR